MIKLQNITKVYGSKDNEFQALKEINLDIDKGEFLSIMGPSGSGKSTLMNILGALDKPSKGKYYLNGEEVNLLPANQLASFRNKQIGFIFQQFNLLERTSVFDNVALPGLYGSLENLKEKVINVLDQVGLKDKVKNLPNQLSGGQIQRVAIARALLMRPSILMADEPTGNLDSKTAQEIMELIKTLHNEGNTIILVTHEQEIAEYAKRLIELKDGKIISDKAI